jgi:hypothetical protein
MLNNEPEFNQDQALIPPAIVAAFKSSYPWLRFIGILTFIYCGVFIFLGACALFGGIYILKSHNDTHIPVWFYGVYSVIGGVIYFFPAVFAYNFGTKLKNFSRANFMPSLESALKNNKWKFAGILCAINIAILLLCVPFLIFFVAIFT